MIKKAVSHRFPARVCVSACPFLFPFVLSLNSFLSIRIPIFVCFAFWVGVSEFLSMCFIPRPVSLFRFAFSKRRGREEVTADYYEYH